MWSLPVRQPVKVNGSTFERPANHFHTEKDTLIISTDATPSPGLSRVSSVVVLVGMNFDVIPVDCLSQQSRRDTDHYTNTWYDHGCCALLPWYRYTPCHVQCCQCRSSPGTRCVYTLQNAVCMPECSTDGSERQAIKDTDGDVPRPRVRYCSICDPFILIIREDDSIGLFVGEAERGKIRRKDMSPMGEKVR